MLKKLFVTLSVSGALASTSAFAVEAPISLPQVNLAAAFEKSEQPMQIAALSTEEMKATQGAYWVITTTLGITTVVKASTWTELWRLTRSAIALHRIGPDIYWVIR